MMPSRHFAALALALALPCALAARPAFGDEIEAAQEPAGPAWTVQVDPLTTALGYVHVQVERRLGDRASIYAGPHLRLFEGVLSDEEESYLGLGVEAGVRWFFRGGAPAGFWAQVRGVAAHIESDADSALGGYASVLGGYTWILRDRWVLSAGLGVQYLHYKVGDLGTEGVLPAAHTTLGFAF